MSNDPTQQIPTGEPTPTTMWAPPTGTPGTPEPAPKKKMSKGKKWAIGIGAFVALGILGNLGDKTPATTPAASSAGNFPTVDPSVQASLDAAAAKSQADAKAAADEKAKADAEAKKKAEADAAAAKAEADKALKELNALTDKKTYAKLSSRDFAKVMKNPDAYVGKKYVIYAHVTQFDAATGTDTFRADVDDTRHSESYEYDTNSIVDAALPGQFDDIVEDDLVTLYVQVTGSFEYETTLGGNMTVPRFTANMFTRTGSTN